MCQSSLNYIVFKMYLMCNVGNIVIIPNYYDGRTQLKYFNINIYGNIIIKLILNSLNRTLLFFSYNTNVYF